MDRHLLSKTTFMYGTQCAKRLWLNKFRPREREKITLAQGNLFNQGTQVGLLAQSLFPGGIDSSAIEFNYQKAVLDTMKYIRNGHQIIYEATFQYNQILCMVDILVKANNKWYAYEVKSTTGVKDIHVDDAALQYYVLTNAGINLSDLSIIHLNRNYIRQGELDIHQLFHPESIIDAVRSRQSLIHTKSLEFLSVLKENLPPERETGVHCLQPYRCNFYTYCHKDIPQADSNISAQIPDSDEPFLIGSAAILSLHTWSSPVPLFDGHYPYKQSAFQYGLQEIYENEMKPDTLNVFLEKTTDGKQRNLIENLLRETKPYTTLLMPQEAHTPHLFYIWKTDYPDLAEGILKLEERICLIRIESATEAEWKELAAKHFGENKFDLFHAAAAENLFHRFRNETDPNRKYDMEEILNRFTAIELYHIGSKMRIGAQ